MLSYEQRLARLLTAAARVFAQKGYHPTSMRELSRETGMSLAGIYHYVSGKDELLYLIQRRCFAQVLSGAASAGGDGPPAGERLKRVIGHHNTFFSGNKIGRASGKGRV